MTHVVKIGGSLLDLPDLKPRLQRFFATCTPENLLVVVGGGRAADLARAWDAMHQVGEHAGHWLAVRAMQLNAHMLAAVLPQARLVEDQAQAQQAWEQQRIALVDPVVWLEHLERIGCGAPARWSFTSDSIAAHLAGQLHAQRLTLLKSTLPKSDCGLSCAVGLGVVDDDFPAAAGHLAESGGVQLVNLRADDLRAWQPVC